MTLHMERIDKNSSGSWDCYAGALGHHVGTFTSKRDARSALDDWHYFNPQERREQSEALVYHIVQYLREAHEHGEIERGFDAIMRRYGGAS